MNIDYPDMGGGIIHDLPSNQIPRNVWSDGNNVRFIRAHVEKIAGHTEIFGTATSTASVTAKSLALGSVAWMIQAESTAGVVLWVYCDLNAIYYTDGITHADITHSGTGSGSISLNASRDYGFNGGLINRHVIINSHAQAPRRFIPNTGTKTKELSAWPSSTLCRVMRTYKNYMVALGLDEGSGFNDQIVRWSHPVPVGGDPTNASWDYTDATLDSGRVELDDGFGRLVDCKQLRNDNIIYAEHAIYRMAPVVSGDIFNFRRIFSEVGLLASHCIATVRHRHVILGDGDVYVHDGQNIESIITKRWKKWLFSQMGSNWTRSFVVPNYANNEIWFCFPTGQATYPDKAMIWSFDDNTLTSRDIPETAFIAYGRIPAAADDTFDGGAILTFEGESGLIFNNIGANTTEQDMVMAQYISATVSAFFEIDSGLKFDNDSVTAYVEKDALILEPNGKFTQRNEYQIHAIRPRVVSAIGGNLGVRVGMRETLEDPVTWVDSATYAIGVDTKVDIRATGKIPTVRFTSLGDFDWELNGFSVDFDRVGGRR